MHDRIPEQLQQCLDIGNVPDWMVMGRTNLVTNDKRKGQEVGNFSL